MYMGRNTIHSLRIHRIHSVSDSSQNTQNTHLPSRLHSSSRIHRIHRCCMCVCVCVSCPFYITRATGTLVNTPTNPDALGCDYLSYLHSYYASHSYSLVPYN